MSLLLIERAFAYDNFTPDEIAGVFTVPHLLCFLASVAVIALALLLSRGLTQKGEWRVRLAVAVIATVIDVAKILVRMYKQMWIETFLPLYFCSIFILAIWLSLLPQRLLSAAGKSFLATGGIVGGVAFLIYPSTSLVFYPALHPASLHSLIYHSLMIYAGILLLWRGGYRPCPRDTLPYFLTVCIVSLPSLILNLTLGTNFMFLSSPQGIPLLTDLAEAAPAVYTVCALLAQGVLIHLGACVIFRKSRNPFL